MRLCFLMERQFTPYAKWFGTAFNRLACADDLLPDLQGVLSAANWEQREQHLVVVYERIAAMHNDLGLTEKIPQEPVDLLGRPFKVIASRGFEKALRRKIKPESTEGGRLVSILKWPEGAPLNLG